MFCPNCGAHAQDNAKFCPGCGKPMEVPQSAPENGTAGVWSNGETRIPAYAAPVAQPDVSRAVKPRGYRSAPEGGSRKVLLGVGTGLVALILVIVLVVNLVGGPMVTLGRAVQKTFEADNGTASFVFNVDGETVRGEFQYAIDWKNRDITVYGTMKVDGMKGTIAIYDGYAIADSGYGTTAVDISDELDELFEAYEDAQKELELDEILELLEEQTGVSLDDYIDTDAIPDCMEAYGKKLNSESWLKENAGFTTEKQNGTSYYCFAPKTYQFIAASIPFFESIFEDPDDYEDIMDELKDEKAELNDIKIELTFGVKSGYLSEILLEMNAGRESFSYDVELTNIGKTRIDTDELEDLLDEAL